MENPASDKGEFNRVFIANEFPHFLDRKKGYTCVFTGPAENIERISWKDPIITWSTGETHALQGFYDLVFTSNGGKYGFEIYNDTTGIVETSWTDSDGPHIKKTAMSKIEWVRKCLEKITSNAEEVLKVPARDRKLKYFESAAEGSMRYIGQRTRKTQMELVGNESPVSIIGEMPIKAIYLELSEQLGNFLPNMLRTLLVEYLINNPAQRTDSKSIASAVLKKAEAIRNSQKITPKAVVEAAFVQYLKDGDGEWIINDFARRFQISKSEAREFFFSIFFDWYYDDGQGL